MPSIGPRSNGSRTTPSTSIWVGATTVDPYESARRVVATGRGGYCFHLNGALSVLLAALGFDVRWHRGGVSDGGEPNPFEPFANHLALTVHGLPTPDAPDGVWFVDAGLGDALYEPIPLPATPLPATPLPATPLPATSGGGADSPGAVLVRGRAVAGGRRWLAVPP